MIYLNRAFYDVLNNISEGITILNKDLEIVLWNKSMEYLTNRYYTEVINKNIYDVLSGMNKHYFKKSINNVLKNGYKMFFSAAMHKNIIFNKKVNIKISRIEKDNENFILIEFIDIINQYIRIEQLKKYINKLKVTTEKLKEKERTIHKLAYYDGLTGVANRMMFYKIGEDLCQKAKQENKILALMFIDIDKFKNINDTYGHKSGDNVLIRVADILRKNVRSNDIVCRFGGDEFLILLPLTSKQCNCEFIASKIINSKDKTLEVGNFKINISLSIGISYFPLDGENMDSIIFKADEAMYIAKKNGGNRYYSTKKDK